MHKFRTVAAALVIGVTSLSIVGTASAATTKKTTSKTRCHAIVKGKKSWSVKFCPKPGKSGVNGKNGVNGKDGANGINGKDGHPGKDGVQGVNGKDGVAGQQGAQGQQGMSGLEGAFYAQAIYNAGNTNEGAIASVACDATSSNYTAIAGGVQVLGLDAGANSRNTPVSSSFPGRMNWDTNSPRPNRLDGWIVQFGGNAGATSDKAPEKVIVWALCVPRTDIPVKTTFQQVS